EFTQDIPPNVSISPPVIYNGALVYSSLATAIYDNITGKALTISRCSVGRDCQGDLNPTNTLSPRKEYIAA
ncbi:hypothetical protein FS842_003130, partial [Serendipita sp. 407]